MHRAFGSTQNGSLPAYGASGELRSQLGSFNRVNLRGLGEVAKQDMNPTIKGEVIDKTEFASKFGWCAVYIIMRNRKPVDGSSGYTTKYVVQYVAPGKKLVNTVGEYPDLASAKEEAVRIQGELRNVGSAGGLNGLGAAGYTLGGNNTFITAAATMMYIGADFPGSRPILKVLGRFFKEPKQGIQNGLLIVGFAGTAGWILTNRSSL